MSRSEPLRLSTLFLRTRRDDPADAEVASHRLLVRAGYIRRAAPGIHSWLPLGWRVLRNVEAIVREEMDRAGAQEVHLPALLPREPYETTGRWTEYGDEVFRLRDRKGADLLLGPTHEEMFTLLVKDVCTSYKDLPLAIYQIQTKYRDEARPRAGLLRGREFVMKDSYSFDLDDAGLQASYDAHRAAYVRIFDRLGLPYVIVHAVSGAMGGSASEEFLAPLAVGEDSFVHCPTCGHAANVEAVGAGPDGSDGLDQPGGRCPACAAGPGLELRRGVELGHIFQLGRKYAEALGLDVLGPDGRPVTVTMGSYGIGVSRAVAAIAETTCDDLGLCWPREVAPADVHVVTADRDGAVAAFADRATDELADGGVRVLHDDRSDVSAGVKFRDAELIGVPTIVVVGRSLAADGTVEVRDRRARTVDHVPAAEAVARLRLR
ncbi:MAG TPA: proline--tRNA ligase [Acidimicrobiales bacterium]|nr:proline--tRNA ligase [Acidimicrobiales bacterium]